MERRLLPASFDLRGQHIPIGIKRAQQLRDGLRRYANKKGEQERSHN
jgi:hypothetical protein